MNAICSYPYSHSWDWGYVNQAFLYMLQIPYQYMLIYLFFKRALIPIPFIYDVFLIRVYVMRINSLYYITMDGPDGELFTINLIFKYLNSLR